jgi:hypothetical protein
MSNQAGGGGKWDGPTSYTPPAMLFMRRLNFRLALLVVVAVVPLFVLGTSANLRARADAIRAAGRESGRLARIAARNQSEAFEQASRLLAAVAEAPVVVKGSDGERSAWLKDLLARSPGFADFHVVRADRSVSASALPAEESRALCDEEVHARVTVSKLSAVGSFRTGKGGRTMVYVARPVPGTDLVLGATVTLSWLEQFQGALQLPAGSVLDVLDPAGTILIRLGEKGGGAVGKKHPATANPTTLDDEHPLVETDTDGTRRFFGIAPLVTGGEKKGFLVVVGIPEETITAPLDRALQLSLVVSTLVLLGSLILAQFMAERFVIRRVNGLILATKRLASSDLSRLKARVRVCQDPSELGDLERSFDDMARALERRAQELDAKARSLDGR